MPSMSDKCTCATRTLVVGVDLKMLHRKSSLDIEKCDNCGKLHVASARSLTIIVPPHRGQLPNLVMNR